MAFSKIIAESMDLTDTYNFTGTLQQNGAGIGGVNTPSFHARTSTDQNLTRFTTEKITNFVEDFDVGSCFASNRFTVPSGEGGKYCVFFCFSINSGVAGGDGEAVRGQIYKNGSYLNGFQSQLGDNGGFNMYISNYSAPMTGITTLSAGDYLELYGYAGDQNSSGQIQSNAHTTFGAFKIIE